MERVFLGLGSNVGDSAATIMAAFADLRAFLQDLLFQEVGVFGAALLHRQIVAVEIGRRRLDLGHVLHHRREGVGERVIAGDRQRPQ